jgi:hypothetical protein
MEENIKKKIFISWSGSVSQAVAHSLKDWLKEFLSEDIEPWVSSRDIDSGSIWINNFLTELKSCSIGIICLTPDNLISPYLHFEAGALLAKEIDKSRVCVLLYDLKKEDVKDPLNMFQLRQFKKEEIFELLKTINNHFSEGKTRDTFLKSHFEITWSNFENLVNNAVVIARKRGKGIKSDPVKWIQVAGSGNSSHPLSENVLETCQILGKKLAQQNFGLLTGNWPLVDEEVTKAYQAERKKLGRQEFIKHILRQDVSPVFNIGDREYALSPHMVWGMQAREIDAAILIAGEGGTLQTALWMCVAGKPIFPLAKTGGDAEKYFWACKADPFFLNEKIPGVTKMDFEKLNEPIPQAVNYLMELLDKWVSHS